MSILPKLQAFFLCAVFVIFGVNSVLAQSSRNRSNASTNPTSSKPEGEQSKDESVKTVNLDSSRENKEGTSSGEKEGVAQAPELDVSSGAEQEGFDSMSLVPDEQGGRLEAASEAHTSTRTSARTMATLIPAPRGPILDRNGEPLAITAVAYQVVLRYEIFEEPKKDDVVAFGRHCLEQARKIVGRAWDISDDKLWRHYEHRRWLPLPLTNVIRADEADKLKAEIDKVRGLQLLPIYIRYYPEKSLAGHIIGYVGSKGKLPTGPINHMDPLFERVEGRAGLEKEFNKELTGTPGVWRLMFDEEGNKILDELQIRPKPGGAVVTTLNLKWQREAERLLSEGDKDRRGAMVVLDCVTGEVLVMASAPAYDPNVFIPNISQKDYDALRNNPAGPLGARAFQGRYPPASTFKVMTVASGLKHRKISEDTLVNCPASITIGNHVFKNWSPTPLGYINCIKALAQSNNPFMYQLGMALGAATLMDTAREFGLGSRSGLPIADDPGLVPNSEYMIRNYKRDFMPGDAANLSIGQGAMLATPLQIAHMMAGVANGYLPRLQLIKQIQDGNANVIYAPKTHDVQRQLVGYEKALASVRKGMLEVVQNGTGGRAKLSYSTIAGKSGTAQWGPEKEDKRLAWFAGFMPYENPRYVYVVLYEGRPHEKMGGGAKSAPIVKKFFEACKNDILEVIKPPEDDIPMAEEVDENGEGMPLVPPAIVPENLPPGLYDPTSIEPIKLNEIPTDVDDSSDSETKAKAVTGAIFDPNAQQSGVPSLSDDPTSVPLIPQRGDDDFIPGLQNQIPRHLNKVQTPPISEPSSSDDEEDIPEAEPL